MSRVQIVFSFLIMLAAATAQDVTVSRMKETPVELSGVTVYRQQHPGPDQARKIAPRAHDDRPIYDKPHQGKSARRMYFWRNGARADCNFDG